MAGLFSSDRAPTQVLMTPQAPTPPAAPSPPVRMPDPLSPATLEARRAAQVKQTTGGRSASILTSARGGGTLAGSYAGTKTGG